MSDDQPPGTRDHPWYTVRTAHFEASFLLGLGEEPETVQDVDVEVRLADGSRWSASMVTVAQVQVLMDRWARSGEALGGSYFWCADGLIVRDPGVGAMTRVLTGLFDNGELTDVLQRLDD